MKKLFTFALALVAFAGVANAASVDDLAVLKHSYVLVCDEITGTSANGAGARPGKGVLFGADHFLDVTGGTTANNKGQVDLSVVDALGEDGSPLYVTQDIVDKYGADYVGPHYNCLRLKNAQDVIALKLTAKSKIIIFEQGNNKTGTAARIPKIAKSADLSDALNAAPGEDHPATVSGFKWEYTVDDDGLYYIGSYNGDMFCSFIIIEANEAPGTPTVKVGDQTFEDGLWFKEVTCKNNDMVEEGSTEKIPTVVTYTTDGTAPTAASPKYTGPIKCFMNTIVKFQAFMDLGDGTPNDDFICDGADNEAVVTFSFDAPTITAAGADVAITSIYEGAKNFYALNGGDYTEGSVFTLAESATVSAYSEIPNGNYTTFTTMSTSKDVYVLNPIKAQKLITVSGNAVVDEEATAVDPNGNTIYMIENGAITADKMDFFVKNLTFKALPNADAALAQYQVPAGQEAYIMMSNTNITFQVAEGDSVNVKVICTKNSCKNIDADDNADDPTAAVTDRMCYVNVSGTTYGGEDLKLNPDGNIIEFGLPAGTWTFQKYSGTGNILISSIEITPAEAQNAILDVTINHERPTGLGYTPTEAEVDFTEALTWLGVEAVSTDMLRIENPDGELISDYAPFDGWFNGDGIAETWGSNTKVCVKFFEAIPEGKFTFYDMNGADEDGKTYTVKWQLVNGEKAVRYTINVTFKKPAAVEMEVVDKGIATSVTYDVEEPSYVEKTASITDDQVAAICAELGIGSLAEAKVFGYNPTTKELVANYAGFDGWRDANGDFHTWTGNAEAPACVKYSDGQNYLCYNIAGCEAQTIKTFWAIANDAKAVLVEIDFIYTGGETVSEIVLWEGESLVTGWANQPFFLSDGGTELTANNAKAGDVLRIYGSAPDNTWQVELWNGHWDGQVQRFSGAELGNNEDGTPRESTVVDLATQGYFDFVLTDTFIATNTVAQGWGGTFLLNGDGNLTVTKVSLVQGGNSSIQNVTASKAFNGAIYNLSGQKVGANYKGVVIVNGKKMLMK